MQRALIIHYQPMEAHALAERVRREDFEAAVYQESAARGFRSIRANPPDVIVIDLSRMPSYGRAMGVLLRDSKSLRAIPLVFVEGDPEKTHLVRERLPDAIVAPWQRLGPALRQAVAAPPSDPAKPITPSRPLYRKLGISEGSIVALLDAPKDARQKLVGLPKGVRFQAAAVGAGIVILFARSSVSLGRGLPGLIREMPAGRRLWVVWPKKASGAAGDLSMPVILRICDGYGLAVGKVCAFDETWSAMAFSRRRS